LGDVKGVWVPVPPSDEQGAIVASKADQKEDIEPEEMAE
jgi:hypothetical protein